MKTLSPQAQRWLKGLHLVLAGMWLGGTIVLIIKPFMLKANSDGELVGLLGTMDFVDWYVLVPGAMGTFFTGLVYSIWTKWGWFRHRWIAVKWGICLFGILFGTFALGPWLEGMLAIAQEQGLAAMEDPDFQHKLLMLQIFGTAQGLLIFATYFISTLKPWKKKRAA